MPHERQDIARQMGEFVQGVVDGSCQSVKGREVLQLRCVLLDLLPQILDGIEVRRVGWQLELGEALRMQRKEIVHCLAGVISGSILDQDDVLLGLSQDLGQKVSIGAAGETLGLALPEEAARAVIDQAQDLVGVRLPEVLTSGCSPFGAQV